MKLNKGLLNFMWLFISSLAIKGVGVLRESIIAYTIGNTLEFATFNTLRSLVDFFLAFVIGVPIIESILVPKYAHEYLKNNTISFQPIWDQTLLFSKYLFIASLGMLFLVSYLKTEVFDMDMALWVLIFSVYLALNLSNSVLFSLQKTIGNFQKYSTQSFINAVVTLTITFLLINLIGLKAILISAILGIIFSNILLKRSLRQNLNSNITIDKSNDAIKLKDINFYKMISVNHAIFIGFTGRLLISFENDYQINFYQYSFIIISSFMLVIVSNIASVILYRSATSDSSSLKKTILITMFIALAANSVLYFFGQQIIRLLYQRGQFTALDTENTFQFLKIFLIPYTLFSITQVMIQPFLKKQITGSYDYVIERVGQIIFISIGISLTFGYIQSDYKTAVQILLYFSSFSILLFLTIHLRKLLQPKTNLHTI